MSKSQLMDFLQDSKRATIMHEQDGQKFIESRQDVTHIVEAAKILGEESQTGDMRLAAFIPETVLNSAMLEGWLHDKAAWKKWANDPANAQYRVWKGRL